MLGRWLAANPGLRDELVIATKVGMEPVDGGGVEGLSAPVVEREAARSPERLGVDVIDLYWAHGEDRSVPIEETVAAFGALVARGRRTAARRLQPPVWRVERARAARGGPGVEPYSALQLTTSYVEPRPGRAGARARTTASASSATRPWTTSTEHPDLELWVYSPLVQGSYDRADRPFPAAYDHPGTTARLAALARSRRRAASRASQVVLAWMLARGWKPIVGVSTLEQLDSALAAASLELSPEELAALDAPR